MSGVQFRDWSINVGHRGIATCTHGRMCVPEKVEKRKDLRLEGGEGEVGSYWVFLRFVSECSFCGVVNVPVQHYLRKSQWITKFIAFLGKIIQ